MTATFQIPKIQETADKLDNLNLMDLDTLTVRRPSSELEKRGSVQLSVVSSDSRRQSLFADDEAEREDSEGGEDEEIDDEEDRKRKRQEEVFVDKARAAMVVIGTKDIKDALERQKAVEISRKTPEAKVCHILFHQAKFLMKQNRFREALVFINRALAVDHEQKEWLTEKSRCYLNLLQPDVALQYVDQVLKKDPKYFKAVVLKGEILYSLWDLERAMLCFVEGRRMRPDNTQCKKGVHKVKMALEEIADYKISVSERKMTSKKRSKSAKGRLTSISTSECLMTGPREASVSSRRPSSRLSPLSEASGRSSLLASPQESPKRLARPSTAFVPRRTVESPSVSRSQQSEQQPQQRPIVERPMSAKGTRRCSSAARPKTAVNRRSKDLEVDDIRRFVRESMSGSYKSSTLKCFSGSSDQSSRSGFSSRSFSSSMEDVSREGDDLKPKLGGTKLPKVKTKTNNEGQPRNKVTPGTKVSAFLGQDRIFLDSLLKDKDLKRSKTAYTKRALRIAREVQGFVTEREKYWRHRENFTRYATAEEDTLI